MSGDCVMNKSLLCHSLSSFTDIANEYVGNVAFS